ncbi:Sugar kinase of the NBD/HSP70 family, may contain an N-terminal HTH domain [Bryocella elongata]|uniref:Sugar kinase of the NBD/HSP70 family, may contain an N-terminal HTH domain n=1 Tax=Bryocella elongata TaxID=863522 RepID=A0A1H6C2D2_9BACT|nr:ROK family transcriptional regulator [Bryocella elongata]SEG67134.1 Sugar kinase of the NBD/HSP70 family, may contain an N-terminal HTH domain [Bryocella elongata]
MYSTSLPTHQKTATNRTPREINRSLVLNILRKQQPISRADLARVSGLQRSTISLIIEELIAERLVLEGSTARLPRGRRPTYLQINPQRAILALDIHPEQATLAVSDLCGKIVEQRLINIPSDNRSVAAMVNAVKRTLAEHKDKTFDGIGICLPGRTDPQTDKPIFAPNLHFPIADLSKRFIAATGLRVEIDNVANACVLGEVWFGGTETNHDIVAVNVSEGIGTGILANGQLLRGEHGMAGEFGHVQLMPDGPLCGCGSHGCWEMLASNRAAMRDYAANGGNGISTFPALLGLAQSGDKHAGAALERMATNLGKGLRVIVAALAPKEIVIVGDITSVWHRVGPIIDSTMRKDLLRANTSLRPAYDGNLARLRGAVALVLTAGAVS